jgi:hypothetical protein
MSALYAVHIGTLADLTVPSTGRLGVARASRKAPPMSVFIASTANHCHHETDHTAVVPLAYDQRNPTGSPGGDSGLPGSPDSTWGSL